MRWMIKRALKPSFFFFWNRRCNTRSEDRSNPRVPPIRNTSHSTLTRVREGYRGVWFRVRAAKMRQVGLISCRTTVSVVEDSISCIYRMSGETKI